MGPVCYVTSKVNLCMHLPASRWDYSSRLAATLAGAAAARCRLQFAWASLALPVGRPASELIRPKEAEATQSVRADTNLRERPLQLISIGDSIGAHIAAAREAQLCRLRASSLEESGSVCAWRASLRQKPQSEQLIVSPALEWIRAGWRAGRQQQGGARLTCATAARPAPPPIRPARRRFISVLGASSRQLHFRRQISPAN